MCTQSFPIYSVPNPVDPEPVPTAYTDERLAHLMQTIISQKEENVRVALGNRVNVSEAIL